MRLINLNLDLNLNLNHKKMKTDDLNLIKNLLHPVFRENSVHKAVVFGSFGREDHTKRSDLDLMIIMETDRRFFDRYEPFEEIYNYVKGRAIDMLIYTPEELNDISHRPFIKRIINEGRIIYEH
jgi:predicted nucleotidyltransferase